jgi:hypothetical protein
MPIDMQLWNLVQDNKAAVVDSLLRHSSSYGINDPIYTPKASGATPGSSSGLFATASPHGHGCKAECSIPIATPSG